MESFRVFVLITLWALSSFICNAQNRWTELGRDNTPTNSKFAKYFKNKRGDASPGIGKTAGAIFCVKTDKYGNVYAAGQFENASGYKYVAKWNGITWTELGIGANALNANNNITCISIDSASNTIYAAGNFTNSSGNYYVAKWNGTSWSEPGLLNANDHINCITTDKAGNVYAAGSFTNQLFGNKYVAKWDGHSWKELDWPHTINANISINCLSKDAMGNICAGITDNRGGNNNIAKWYGKAWTIFPEFSAYSIAFDKNGTMYSGGENSVSRWNGTEWVAVGGVTGKNIFNNRVNSIAIDTNGNLYAAGAFTNKKGERYVAKWNGIDWAELDTINALMANNDILSITTDAIGNVYASGGNGYVAKYGFTPLGNYQYVFTGDGNWDVPSNWANLIPPPTILTNGRNIIIDPVTDGECVLNFTQNVSAPSQVIIMAGKKFRIVQNLVIQ